MTPTLEQIQCFLSDLHGKRVHRLESLDGGFWSSAVAYRLGERELVLRVGTIPEGFEMDRAAAAFAGPDLPIPKVIDIGAAFGGAYAISERHHGRFLETVQPADAEIAGPAIVSLLEALRAVPVDLDAPVSWYPPGQQAETTWRRWLAHKFVDDPARRVSGWRSRLAADPEIDRLFRACENRVVELAEACPERRDLVHGDLLHGNVLLAEDASRVTAVFSWKCSLLGDFLFDAAWCTFWGGWYPGIAAADVWGRLLGSPSAADNPSAFTDAPTRHHCYELAIGASHLGWYAWTGDDENLRWLATHLTNVLDRGPLDPPRGPGST